MYSKFQEAQQLEMPEDSSNDLIKEYEKLNEKIDNVIKKLKQKKNKLQE